MEIWNARVMPYLLSLYGNKKLFILDDVIVTCDLVQQYKIVCILQARIDLSEWVHSLIPRY